MKNRSVVCLVACAVFVLASGIARADDGKCDAGASPEVKTYVDVKPSNLPRNGPRCDYNKKGNCTRIQLKGYLYFPAENMRSKPAPILIYNHGSGKPVGPECAVGQYFANQGFVVFIPHRFGHGLSTGTYFGDACSDASDPGACKMKFLTEQIDDVAAAIQYVEQLTYKDGSKVGDNDRLVIMGHSYGGIVSQLSNTRDLGQKAIVDVAGGSQSWNENESARSQLKDAVAKGVAPTLYFEPMNDQSIEPAAVLPAVAVRHCRQFELILFPAIDTDEDGNDKDYVITADDYKPDPRNTAHGQTMRQHAKTTYGPATLEFINRYFADPAKPFDKLCMGTSSQPQS